MSDRTYRGGPAPIIGATVVSCIQIGHTYRDHLATDHCLLIGDDGRGISAVPACSECGEAAAEEWGMCSGCIHDARLSGWNPPN